MNKACNARARAEGQSLWHVVEMRRGFSATDPRDFVFANFSIIDDMEQVHKHMNVDYGASVQVVFSQMAAYIIDRCGILTLLAQVNDMHPEKRLNGLPSWIAVWQYPAPHLASLYQDLNAPSVENETCHYITRIGHTLPILGHTGYMIDTIDTISGVVPVDYHLSLPRRIYPPLDSFPGFLYKPSSFPEHPPECSVLSRYVHHYTTRGWLRLFYEDDIPNPIHMYLKYVSDGRAPRRRVAFFCSGRYGLVPEYAQKGDAIISLGKAEKLLIVLQKDITHPEVYSAMIMIALRYKLRERMLQQSDDVSFDWSNFLKTNECVQHYSVIGHGFLEDFTDPCNWYTKENMRVFALH